MSNVIFRIDSVKTKSFTLDQTEIEVPEDQANKVEKLIENVKAAAEVIVDLENAGEVNQAEKDAMGEENEKMGEEKKNLEDENMNLKEESEKKELDAMAEESGIEEEEKEKLDSKHLKIAIIQKRQKSFNPEDKSDEYINARLDAVKELIKSEKENDKKNLEFNKNTQDFKKDSKEVDHRNVFIEKTQALYNK